MIREPAAQHFDVLIIGAGLSGIGAAYHLQKHCANKRYAILEARAVSGGTWDLFRYPGVRSDSDMFTLGYRFRPWLDQKAIADGPDILRYVRETASAYGIDKQIRYGHRLTRASWSSDDAQWTAEIEVSDSSSATTGVRHVVITCNVLYSCMGYYDYRGGYTPDFPNASAFNGLVIHPQQWPEGLDYSGKRVVVIGSGATAITIVPAMAATASHVTMLQRSPTYVMARESTDGIAQKLRAALPPAAAYAAVRWKNVALSIGSFWVARTYPAFMKRFILKHAKRSLNGREYKTTGVDKFDAETHFSPRYNPWDERMCLAPDGDFFKSVRHGKASVVTDTIASFTPNGIQLASGKHLDADIIVTATGLKLQLLSGVQLVVDSVAVQPSHTMVYKGMMFSDVPNFVSAFGYTNASWTLKVDLTADYVCRLINYMDQQGFCRYTPRQRDSSITAEPILDFTSGYVQRALAGLPRQGSKKPWRVHQNYARDLMTIRFGKLNDGVMEFG